MSTTATYTVSQRSGQNLILFCSSCTNATQHHIISGYDESDASPDDEIRVWRQYYIIQCQGCRNVRFLKEHQCSEDYDYETGKPDSFQIIYPISLDYDYKKLIHDTSDLPNDIADVYSQIKTALANNMLILATAGMRLIMEAVVKDKDVTGDDLQAKIGNLADAGHIPKNGIPTLQKIRIFGNQAIHDIQSNSKKELLGALNVVEFMLLSVYVVHESAKKLRINPPNWGNIVSHIGEKHTKADIAAVESTIKAALKGGKLDVDVNPDVAKELLRLLMLIAKSVNLHNWQRDNIVKAIGQYVQEVSV